MTKKIAVFLVLISFSIIGQTEHNITITANPDNTEIFINDSSIGRKDSVGMFLKPGRYCIRGSGKKRFDDYEFASTRTDDVVDVDLSPKHINFQIEVSIMPVVYFDDHNMASMCFNPGMRLKNFYLSGHASHSLKYCFFMLGGTCRVPCRLQEHH